MAIAEEEFGKDIHLQEKEVEVDDMSGAYNKDIRTVVGKDNLIQALKSRLRTQLGELRDHPDYGSNLPSLVGEKATTTNLELAKLYTSQGVNQEPRVSKIIKNETKYSMDEKALLINVQFIPIDSTEPLNLVFPFFIDTTRYSIDTSATPTTPSTPIPEEL